MLDADENLKIDRGCYHQFDLEFRDEATGLPVALTGYTLSASFRERGTTPLLTSILLTITDAVNGLARLVVSEADSLLLPSRDWSTCTCNSFTCWCQIDGTVSGTRYRMADFSIDCISSTTYGAL